MLLNWILWTYAAAALAILVVWASYSLRRRAVERSISTELLGLRWQAAAMAVEITRRLRAGETFDSEFFYCWRLSEPQIFPALGADFGLLSREARGRIGYFHAQLANARERLRLATSDREFRPSAYRILTALARAFNEVEPWARPRLDIVTGNTPDMADAYRILGEFEATRMEPVPIAYLWADGCVRVEDLVDDGEGA